MFPGVGHLNTLIVKKFFLISRLNLLSLIQYDYPCPMLKDWQELQSFPQLCKMSVSGSYLVHIKSFNVHGIVNQEESYKDYSIVREFQVKL